MIINNDLSLVDCNTVNNGGIGFCNCNTCYENEGDCDSHDECHDGLLCGGSIKILADITIQLSYVEALDINCPASLGFDSAVGCCIKGFMSPNYPNPYPAYAEETWLITAPNGTTITLQFHSFDVRLRLKIHFFLFCLLKLVLNLYLFISFS